MLSIIMQIVIQHCSQQEMTKPQIIITHTCSHTPAGHLYACFVQLDVSTIECVFNSSSVAQPIDWSMLHDTARFVDVETTESPLSPSIELSSYSTAVKPNEQPFM